MPGDKRDVLITGIGLVSCLGEGLEAHWNGLTAAKPVIDETSFSPYVVHPLAPVNFDLQIPKKGDQRQMEPWQRIGCYAAGLALDDAGIKGNQEILNRVDMLVAAGGGERDTKVDGQILTDLKKAENPGKLLNERLMSDLRPTLSLAQLANLLAGNISIVFNVVGSSRTFMGEEMAGVDALRIASARIAAGQSEIGFVGGAYNAQRYDVLLQLAFGRESLTSPYIPVWARGTERPGMAVGSLGAFLVIESRGHAEARGARAYAKLSHVAAERCRRHAEPLDTAIGKMLDGAKPRLRDGEAAVISSATGAVPATTAEKAALEKFGRVPVRATGSVVGHGVEASFPLNVGLAALAVSRGGLWPALDSTGFELPFSGSLRQAVVTGISAWRGEGLALVEAA
ncbi:MAG TPA: beta-ketoacyl-ACP synthase [Xanthobacteraceae bacterium]|nr:beta-ketoacyl-ACP synthase [Xanthobacteraceae bacterium]